MNGLLYRQLEKEPTFWEKLNQDIGRIGDATAAVIIAVELFSIKLGVEKNHEIIKIARFAYFLVAICKGIGSFYFLHNLKKIKKDKNKLSINDIIQMLFALLVIFYAVSTLFFVFKVFDFIDAFTVISVLNCFVRIQIRYNEDPVYGWQCILFFGFNLLGIVSSILWEKDYMYSSYSNAIIIIIVMIYSLFSDENYTIKRSNKSSESPELVYSNRNDKMEETVFFTVVALLGYISFLINPTVKALDISWKAETFKRD